VTLTRRQIRDVLFIEGIEEEMIPLLPRLRNRTGTANPWVRNLPGILRGLHLRPGQTVLDIPCGEGGVSVPLARRYGVRVTGHDILPDRVEMARSLARRRGVDDLCRYTVKDIRDVPQTRRRFDLLLWIAPPQIWKRTRATIRALRSLVREGGIILVGDAYLWRKGKEYESFETLEAINRGLESCGDRLVRVYDYERSTWKRDYRAYYRIIEGAIRRARDPREKEILRRLLRRQRRNERLDTRHLGTAIWIVRRA
jgi:SAM-dependent methyltransferase